MTKVTFSNHELDRFLLIGENNQYIVDKINPLIRAFKRKKSLAIFSTIRIKNKTTTVKLGDFPECSLDEIYAKFEVAQKISRNGNNPNLVFNSFNDFSELNNNNLNNLSLQKILVIFLQKKKSGKKYSNDIKNNLKNNLKDFYYEPITKLTFKVINNNSKILLQKKKIATAKNFLNYLQTILNFSVNNNIIKEKDEPIELINRIKNLKNKIKPKPKNKTSELRTVLVALKNLNKTELLETLKFIKNMKNEFRE